AIRISSEDLANLPNGFLSTSALSDCRFTLDVITRHDKTGAGFKRKDVL
ncbi:uncharacterized, partial [Tachysurus ichikawai]